MLDTILAFLVSALKWLRDNPAFLAMLWLVITGVVSTFWGKLETSSRWSGIVKLLESFGFDVHKFLDAIKLLIQGTPPGGAGGISAGSAGSNSVGSGRAAPGYPRTSLFVRKGGFGLVSGILVGIVLSIALLATVRTPRIDARAHRAPATMVAELPAAPVTEGCKWFEAKGPDLAALGECVLAHSMLPPEQIAVVCAAQDLQQVLDLLAAHRAAAKREAEAAAAARGDAGP